MPEGEENGNVREGETVLARKLRQTLDLKLENDRDTMQALGELSTFFHVGFYFINLIIIVVLVPMLLNS
jgi:hypothetical protein